MHRFAACLLGVALLSGATDARAQATSLDDVPIAWGEADERHTTVCAKRWHAIRIRDIRTRAVDQGLGADAQIEQESRAIFNGGADCYTGQIVYRPVAHADVILGARTWVQVVERDGAVPCFNGLRCRWTIQSQSFVEAKVEIDGKAHPATVYVATPRPVQPARVDGPPPVITGEKKKP
ncbi:MAG: hypothetical protein JJ900_00195 [Rhodospirillales bacterium]|nr:hypothetical protein [Rhodospirillales bacterium]MBO6785235.1 hypothetical protein [Rhodospirillales bacterium]